MDGDDVVHRHHRHCVVSMWWTLVFLLWLVTWCFHIVLVVLGVDEDCRWLWSLATVVVWWQWVGIMDGGGGC